MPRVSSLQSLTLGTRSVICSFPSNSVSDTGHKSAPLWFILTQTPGPMTNTMYNIWDGSVLRQFKGPDSKAFFKSNPSNMEIHLAFSMFVDWFNLFGTKQSGKHVSFGAVYMVCLNLPVDLRYQLENVYLAGIIPGPHEPSSYHLNHVIQPLVDDLIDALVAWIPVNPHRCLVLCVVIPLVCDLLAARKTAGFAGLGNLEGKYCSFCWVV